MNEQREDCRVYWASHGCCLKRGHEGECYCDCEDGPQERHPGTVFYGEDAEARGLNTDPNVRWACGHCGGEQGWRDPDPCLGWLDNVSSACCGHGDAEDAYVVFKDWHPAGQIEMPRQLRGQEAADYFLSVAAGGKTDG